MLRLNSRWSAFGLALSLFTAAPKLLAQPFAIAIGDTVSDGVPAAGAGRIAVHTETDFYTFAGTAGQSVFFEDLNVSASFAGWLRWEVKAPSGASVFASYLDTSVEGRRTLPEDGAYTLRVWVGTVNVAYVGTYSFRLRPIPADHTFPIQIGDTIANGVPAPGAGNIEVAGAGDYYTFTATAGQLIFLENVSVASSFEGYLFFEIKSPGNLTVLSGYLTPNANPGRKELPEAGTYQMRVEARSNDPDHVGIYSLRLRGIAPDQQFAIQPGDTVSNGVPAPGAGNIEMPGAVDTYTFPGTAGQSLTFQRVSVAPAFAGWLKWELVAPSGANVFSGFFTDAGRKTLPETGTYRLRFSVGSTDETYVGTYSFSIIELPGNIQATIAKGQVVADGAPVEGAGRIDEPGGLDTYLVDGLVGQIVDFEQLAAAPNFQGNLYWEILRPNGTVLFKEYFPGNETRRQSLPETGNYTIRVYPITANANYIGTYSLRVSLVVTALADQFATIPNTALAIPASKFLCNDNLQSGDAGTIETTSATSEKGGSLAVGNGVVTYTPPAGFSGLDRFIYRLRGQFGGTDEAEATVRVSAGLDQSATTVSLVRNGMVSVLVCLLGAPNQSYEVEQSDDLKSWTHADSLTADATGSMTYTYLIEAVDQRYFRFRRQ